MTDREIRIRNAHTAIAEPYCRDCEIDGYENCGARLELEQIWDLGAAAERDAIATWLGCFQGVEGCRGVYIEADDLGAIAGAVRAHRAAEESLRKERAEAQSCGWLHPAEARKLRAAAEAARVALELAATALRPLDSSRRRDEYHRALVAIDAALGPAK